MIKINNSPTKKSAFADHGGPTRAKSNLDCHPHRRLAKDWLFVKPVNKKSVEVAGFAPAEPWVTIQVPYSSTPTPN